MSHPCHSCPVHKTQVFAFAFTLQFYLFLFPLSLHDPVCVCAHAHMHKCYAFTCMYSKCICACVCTHMCCGSLRAGIFLSHSPPYSLRQTGTLTEPPVSQAGLLTSDAISERPAPTHIHPCAVGFEAHQNFIRRDDGYVCLLVCLLFVWGVYLVGSILV